MRYITYICVIDIILLYSKENKIMIHHREYLVLFLLQEKHIDVFIIQITFFIGRLFLDFQLERIDCSAFMRPSGEKFRSNSELRYIISSI